MWCFDRDVFNSCDSFPVIFPKSEPSATEERGDTPGGDTELHPEDRHGDGGGGDHLRHCHWDGRAPEGSRQDCTDSCCRTAWQGAVNCTSLIINQID